MFTYKKLERWFPLILIVSIIWLISIIYYNYKYLAYNNVIIINNTGKEIAQFVACDCIYEKYKNKYIILVQRGDSILSIYNPDTITCIVYKNQIKAE